MEDRNARQRVTFTRQQIEFLDKMFPEIIGNASTTSDELRWRAAQRAVLAVIKERVLKERNPDGPS